MYMYICMCVMGNIADYEIYIYIVCIRVAIDAFSQMSTTTTPDTFTIMHPLIG